MSRKGKRYGQAVGDLDPEKLYPPGEALAIVRRNAGAKFDETIELSIRLGIDDTKADQKVRGTLSLPQGTGKSAKVIVFAQADKAREAREAGADEVGDQELASRIEKGWTDFDVAIATPDLMPIVGKLGRILRAKTPSPKSGTVTTDISKAVREFKGGKIEYRNDKFGNIHVVIGKASFDLSALAENYLTVADEILRVKPAAAKGRYVKSITMSSSMGPGVKVDPASIRDVSLPAEEPQEAVVSG